MKQSLSLLIGTFALIGVAATGAMLATPAFAQDQEKEAPAKSGPMTAPHAKLTPVQAMSIAVAKSGGKATRATFEFDEGHWVYGVLVVKDHKLFEVELDPVTGKVGDTESVTPEDEAKETQQELSAMIK